MKTKNKKPIKVVMLSAVSAYAPIFGAFALISAILAFLIPVFGTIFITPTAILFGIIALWGGAERLGMMTFIILVIKLAISPTFWINLWIGAVGTNVEGNRFLSYIIVLGMLFMFLLLFKKSKSA